MSATVTRKLPAYLDLVYDLLHTSGGGPLLHQLVERLLSLIQPLYQLLPVLRKLHVKESMPV